MREPDEDQISHADNAMPSPVPRSKGVSGPQHRATPPPFAPERSIAEIKLDDAAPVADVDFALTAKTEAPNRIADPKPFQTAYAPALTVPPVTMTNELQLAVRPGVSSSRSLSQIINASQPTANAVVPADVAFHVPSKPALTPAQKQQIDRIADMFELEPAGVEVALASMTPTALNAFHQQLVSSQPAGVLKNDAFEKVLPAAANAALAASPNPTAQTDTIHAINAVVALKQNSPLAAIGNSTVPNNLQAHPDGPKWGDPAATQDRPSPDGGPAKQGERAGNQAKQKYNFQQTTPASLHGEQAVHHETVIHNPNGTVTRTAALIDQPAPGGRITSLEDYAHLRGPHSKHYGTITNTATIAAEGHKEENKIAGMNGSSLVGTSAGRVRTLTSPGMSA